jgi:serine/threonine protein kinase
MGTYRVVRLLGEGGMGAVYLAHDDTLDRPVAIKTMRPEVAARPGAVDRFLREARAAAKVAHDHVVPILHVGQDAGTPFIAMPLLEGEPLDGLLKWEPRPPLGVTLKVGREVAAGLAAAHAKGLIHRDIKPANIWIEGDPAAGRWEERFRRVKLLDFGLARPAAAEDTQLTGQGVILGTPAFMSPEQARGEPIDHRTDLWSLGVVLYRMATGRLPFRGANAMAVLIELATHAPPAPADLDPAVSPALSDLVMRLIAKECDQRPATAAAVEAELRAIGRQLAQPTQPLPVVVRPLPVEVPDPFADLDANHPPGGADETELEVPPPPASKGGRGLWAAAGGAALLAAAAVAAVLLGGLKKQPLAESAPSSRHDLRKPEPKPDPKADPDRAAAEWVLSTGGKVWVEPIGAEPPGARRVDAGTTWVDHEGWPANRDSIAATRSSELPKEFRLLSVDVAWLPPPNKVTGGDLQRFAGLKHLTYLNLLGADIGDADLEHLTGLPGLQWLNVQRTRVTDDGLRTIGRMTQLRGLHVLDLPITGAGLRHLSGLTELETLGLMGTAVQNADLVALAALPRLRYVWFMSVVDNDGVKHLAALPQLQALDLIDCRMTEAGLAHLSKAKKLKRLDLTGTKGVNDVGLAHLAELPALTNLNITETSVTAAGVEAFRKARPGCTVEWSEPKK